MYWFIAVVPIIVAMITGPVVVVLQRLRKENTEQHGESRGLLEHMVIKVDKIHDELGGHIKEHKNGNKID